MYYNVEKKEDGLWLCEPEYNPEYNKKTESVFAQCNGRIGVRACTELRQLEEERGTFLSGFYHKANEYEVTELVNCPDVTRMDVAVNGEKFLPDTVRMECYERKLNVRNGELYIHLICDLPKTGRIEMESRRFASKEAPELLCNQISIRCENKAAVEIVGGIDGQIGNGGVSHLERVECRALENHFMGLDCVCDDGQGLRVLSVFTESDGGDLRGSYFLERRSIYGAYKKNLEAGECWTINKFTLFEHQGLKGMSKADELAGRLQEIAGRGYEAGRAAHEKEFEKFWKMAEIRIEGATLEEEAGIAFAQYHLAGMVPWRGAQNGYSCSVGAKGLTGQGYKGHVFWDTELFVMPMFSMMFPEVARNLLLYRHERLGGARKKARENGYEGAMYPWESAGTGEEETPLYAAIDIHTGKAAKVWSGIKEHHVTADIIHGLLEYYELSGDEEFMDLYGNEMILETAVFWYGRAVWIKERQRYEILDIIGPDEYTEHVDNNAYTNYLAYENVKAALSVLGEWQSETAGRYLAEGWREKWSHFLEYLYLPKENEAGIIPQDDTFLGKKELPEIRKYREAGKKQTILKDYGRDEVVDMQVLKQADVVLLLNLFPDMFEKDVVKKNVEYYEARTIHDSSLSLCAHAIALAQIGEEEAAMDFYKKAMEIDLCENCEDTRDGIHAASLGGILNCLFRGFAGMHIQGGTLAFNPRLPKHWKRMEFFMKHRKKKMRVVICKEQTFVSEA